MGSRIRDKTEHLFEVFLEIAKPNGKDEAPIILHQYPEDYDDKEALMMIPRFAYPCAAEVTQVDHFTFVLTDLDSMFRFGYCRHTPGNQGCLCILSWLPWYEIFYKMLDLLAEIINRSENNHVTTFLHTAYAQEVPLPKIPVTIIANQDMFSFTAPDPNVLPRIPNNRNLTEYYNAVDPNNMMLIFASMLHERRIYMTSKKLSRLTSCIHAAETLLYPMHWQHLYIPVLPAHLIDYISAPMPYLIGIHSTLVEKLTQNRVDVGDAVVVDLDANTVTTDYDDLGDLPEDVILTGATEFVYCAEIHASFLRQHTKSSYLKRNLKTDVIKSSVMKTGDAISMAFLNALVRLIGGYRDALKFRPSAPITFDPEAFVRSRPSQSTQAFLEGMLTLQIFQQFVFGRLEILNAGDGFRDIFEQQASLFADKLNSQSTYKEWLKSVKKSGKKGWNGLKVKAAPMMSTAVHSVKEQGKKAMADFKTKFSGLSENDEKKYASVQVSGGVVHSKTRPVTMSAATLPRTQRAPLQSGPSSDFERRTRLASRSRSIEEIHDDSQLRLSYHMVDVSLITDTDIQTAMMRSASAEILSSRAENSSIDSSSDSSGFEKDGNDSNIAFDSLNSSDEGLNVPPADGKKQQDTRHSGTGDKLILTRPASGVAPLPVAAPRKKKVKPSPNLKSQTDASFSQTTGPSSQGETPPRTASVQDAPLIKFDSSESEPTDSENFDPLFSKSSAERSRTPTGMEESGVGSRAGTPSGLSQTKPDSADQKMSREGSAQDLFDPLSDLTAFSNTAHMSKPTSSGSLGQFVRRDPLSSRRDSSDLLMHEWSLSSLSRGHNISLPRAAQPLRMSFPNNPFILGPSAFSSTSSRPGTLHNLGQNQFRAAYIGHKVTDFHKTTLPNIQRQPFRTSSTVLPAPRHLSPASLAPYTRPPSPMTSGTLRSASSTTSLNSLSSQAEHPATNPTSGVGMIPPISPSSSQTHLQKESDFFNDLLDIDFGSKQVKTESPEPPRERINKVPSPHSSQPKWETFD